MTGLGAVVLLVTCLQVQPKALSPVDILRRLQGWSVDYDAVSSHHARAEDSPFNKPLVSPASGEYALERGSIPRGEESPKREEQSPPRGENPVKGSAKEKDGAREKGPAKKDAAQEKSPNPDRGSREAVQPDLFTSGSSFPFLPRAGERRVIVDEAALVDLQEKPGAWGISDMEDLQYLKKYLSHFDQNFGEKIRSHVPSEWGEEKRADEKYTAETHEPFRVAPRSDNDTLVFYSDPRRPSAFRDVAVPLAVSFEDDNSDLPYQEPSLVCRALGRSYCSVDEDHPRAIFKWLDEKFSGILSNFSVANSPEEPAGPVLASDHRLQDSPCESTASDVQPSWIRDEKTDEWVLAVQTMPLQQWIRVEHCLSIGVRCQYVLPYYRSVCEERNSLHQLLVWNPRNPEVLGFSFLKAPSGCGCHVNA